MQAYCLALLSDAACLLSIDATGPSQHCFLYSHIIAGRSILVVTYVPDCGMRGCRFESHHEHLRLSWQPLWYTTLGTGCTPLLHWIDFDSAFHLPSVLTAFSALTLLVGRQEGHLACKKLSGGMLAWLSGMRCRLAYSPADATATHYLLLQ